MVIWLLKELSLFFDHIRSDLESVEDFSELIKKYGWETESLNFNLHLFEGILADIRQFILLTPSISVKEPDKVIDAYNIATSIFDKLKSLDESAASSFDLSPLNQEEFWKTFIPDLIQGETISFMSYRYPLLTSFLSLFQVFEFTYIHYVEDQSRIPYLKKT